MIRRTFVLAVLGLVCTTRAAYAANDTIATALQGVPGKERSQTLVADGVGYYGYNLSLNRSYVVLCWEPFLESQFASSGFCTVDIRNGSDTVVSTSTSSGVEPFPKGGIVHTFTPTASNSYWVRVRNANLSSTQTVNFILMETTLASPWYFVNAASGYEAFVEIRNQSGANALLTVRAYNANGFIAGSTTVFLNPDGNTAVAVSSLGITTGSGSLSITHNAMPGSIYANTTTLSGATGLSFDSPFTPKMVWSTF